MPKMKNLNISTRLVLVFGGLMLALALVMTVALLQMKNMRSQTMVLIGKSLPSITLVQRLTSSAINLRLLETQHVLNFSGITMETIEKAMKFELGMFSDALKEYQALLNSSHEAEALSSIEKSWDEFQSMHAKIIEMSVNNSKDAARALLDDPVTKAAYENAPAATQSAPLMATQTAPPWPR